jgi:RNA polymerase sigma-70 factor (ECF subfamily)
LTNAPTDEAWLVVRAQAGSRPHLERLIEAAQQFLEPRLASLIGDAADVDDVLQDVLFLICRRVGSLKDARLFRPWAHRIAIRSAWKAIHRRHRDQGRIAEVELDDIPDPGSRPNDSALLELLHRVSPASRVVMTLHYIDSLTLEAIASELGLAPGTVKSRLAYGLKQLRDAKALG